MSEVLNLTKGERVDLTKTHPGLTKVHVGLGWDVNAGTSGAFDLDSFALILKGGKLLNGSSSVVFFNNKTQPGVTHQGDNLTGVGDGDDEIIDVDFNALPADAEEVIIGVNIYDAANRRQHFGMVNNAFIRVLDGTSNQEFMKYDLSEDYSGNNGMLLGRLYKHNTEWKFQALGNPANGNINEIAAPYIN